MPQLIVVPAYNEEGSIARVLASVREAAPDFAVVVVNDGSTDDTTRIVRESGVPQLRLPCNLGYARALQTGLLYAVQCGYEIVAFLDADGQHDPRDVPRLARLLRDGGADVVIGSRFVGATRGQNLRRTPFSRRLGMSFFSAMTGVFTGKRIHDTTSGFKVLNARAARELLRARFFDFHAEVLVYLILRGYRVEEAPIEVRERTSGRSIHSLLSAFTYPLQTLLLLLLAAVQARLAGARNDPL